jgi:hypothetical protein
MKKDKLIIENLHKNQLFYIKDINLIYVNIINHKL